MTILILGYYDKFNFGDEQYKITIPIFLNRCGIKDQIIFKNPHDIDIIPSDTKIVICGGGDIINDWFFTKINILLEKYKGPIFALSIGITYESTIIKKYLDKFKLIIIRHSKYMEKLSTIIGSSNVMNIPDLGFLYPKQVPKILNNKQKIGIFLANGALSQQQLSVLFDTLTYYRNNYEIILYHMNISNETHEGDRYITHNLFKSHNINNINELLSNIGGLYLSICVRYHSHIFSIVQEIPFVSLALTPKTCYLMDDIGFNNNVCTSVENIKKTIDWTLEHINLIKTKVIKIKTRCLNILNNCNIPFIKKDINDIYNECKKMLSCNSKRNSLTEKDEIINDIVSNALWYITGTTENKYTYGFIENLKKKSYNLFDMLNWIYNDFNNNNIKLPGINFFQPTSSFSGVHRSGWEMVTNSLQCLEDKNGILLDLYLDATFNWQQKSLSKLGVIPFTKKWIGIIHHTDLPEKYNDYTHYTPTKMFENNNFLASLKHCNFLITLSDYLNRFVIKKLYENKFYNIKVYTIKHPTEIISKMFNYSSWLKNPTFTQIGAWMRNSYFIYKIQLKYGTKQVLEGKKMENYIHPDKWYIVNTMTCKCKHKYDNNYDNKSDFSCISRHGCNIDDNMNENIMTKFMTKYAYEELKGPSFLKICKGDKCCKEGDLWPINWIKKIEYIKKKLIQNYKSVTILKYLSNIEYDLLLQKTVVIVNLLNSSAANTIIECIVRNTPIIVNRLPANEEYLGLNYPGFYKITDFIDKNKCYNINKNHIQKINEYLKKINKNSYMIDTFIKSIKYLVNNV